MATTPEGKVKAAVNKVLARYGAYKFMPVQAGFGASTLDYLICVNGVFIAVETKAPGKTPTPRQEQVIREIEAAGGKTFVIDGVDKCGPLAAYLEQVKQNATSTD